MLRLYIVDDEILANQYMMYLLQRIGIETQVVGQATNSMKAYTEILSLKPDVVFADINMPVMDGLELAERILSRVSTRIIFLTAYKDFNFVKKGMQLGAVDYVLKNELNEAYLEQLLTRIDTELQIDRKKQHVLLEHNIREFLRNTSSQIEDHAYEDRPMQRYGLIYLQKMPRICIRHVDEDDAQKFDSYALENLEYPDGITCNAVTEMSRGVLCGIFFVDEKVADGQILLREAAARAVVFLEYHGCEVCAMVSDTRYHFFELQESYKTLKKLSGYMYAAAPEKVLMENEMTISENRLVRTDEWIRRIDEAVRGQNQTAAWKTLQNFCAECRKNLDIWNYLDNMRAFYRYLREYIQENALREAILDIPDSYHDSAQLEKTLSECLALVFESYGQKKESDYSVYVQVAIAYICHHYSEDISIPRIAQAAQISDGHLRRLFRQEVGMKVLDYLTEYRLECAKLLMRNKENTLTEIWKKTGFASAQYFSYVFKRKEGILPKDYMKQYRDERE